MRSIDSPPHRRHGEPLTVFVARMSHGLAHAALGWLDVTRLDPERVHDLRVATKRLRSRWLLVAPAVGAASVEAAQARLKSISNELSASRDRVVLDETLERLRRRARKPARRKALRSVQGYLSSTQPPAAQPPTCSSESLESGWRAEATTWARGLPYSDDELLLEQGLGRTYRKARRLGKKALRSGDDSRLHRWRKWVKYLTYQLELIGRGPELEEMVTLLTRLGRVLGRHHDLMLVNELLDAGVARSYPKAARRARKELRREARRLERKAKELFDRTLQSPVSEFLTQVRGAAG